MAVQEIPDTYFYRLDSQSIDGTLLQKASLVVDQFYIKIDDYYSFYTDQDVDVYKIISSTQADVYKANKYNYQSLSKPDTGVTKPPTAIGLYQSITIDGLPIARVICNNQIIWSQSAEPQEAYNITAYVDANVSKLNDYAVIDYNQDFATYGVVWHRVDKVAVEVDGKIVAKLQKPVRTVAGGGAMLSIETWTYPFDGIDKYKNPTFKISQH
ncbi:phage protein [Streptococcus dysgalactiae]|nr:phage protein [Streptococcus dysgalactiae]SQB66513.1 phage protein [Streptococcus dysgalactiae]